MSWQYKRCSLGIIICFIFLLGIAFQLHASEEQKTCTKNRSVSMAAEFTGVAIPQEEEVSIDLFFYNRGKTDETMQVQVSQTPEGWTARVKTYRYTVSGIHLPACNDKTLTFEAKPEKNVKPGEYTFVIHAVSADQNFNLSQTIIVTVLDKKKGDNDPKGVKLTTSYPVLSGPSDSSFEFSVEVESKLEKDAIFDLFAQGPEDWSINFKPAYESKLISSIRLKANESKTVAIEVKPGGGTQQQGDYPVHIRVSSGEALAEADLTVKLTGTYDLEIGTPSGLLSLDAQHGKPSMASIYIRNTGTAPQGNIHFMAFKPENWDVNFSPENIDMIEPGELKQVEVTIKPYEEALVGDYAVNLSVEGEKTKKNLEFRVTVKASSAWAGIGIGVIFCVIIGLGVLFRKLGRR